MRESIFDPVRKKRVALTPEEGVRQQLIQELSSNLGYPLHLMSCEYYLVINRLKYRGDLVIFNKEIEPIMIAECKSPDVKITRESFEQIARYNYALQVKFLLVTNGLETFMGKIDPANGKYIFLKEIPNYNELS